MIHSHHQELAGVVFCFAPVSPFLSVSLSLFLCCEYPPEEVDALQVPRSSPVLCSVLRNRQDTAHIKLLRVSQDVILQAPESQRVDYKYGNGNHKNRLSSNSGTVRTAREGRRVPNNRSCYYCCWSGGISSVTLRRKFDCNSNSTIATGACSSAVAF